MFLKDDIIPTPYSQLYEKKRIIQPKQRSVVLHHEHKILTPDETQFTCNTDIGPSHNVLKGKKILAKMRLEREKKTSGKTSYLEREKNVQTAKNSDITIFTAWGLNFPGLLNIKILFIIGC